MLHAFFLSGECVELARAEVEYLLSLSNPRTFGRVLVYQGYVSDLVKRLALTREVVRVYSICDFDELFEKFKELAEYLMLSNGKKYCVRVKSFCFPGQNNHDNKNSKNSQELERELGAVLWKKGLKISVSKPDAVVRVYLFSDCVIFGLLVHRLNTKEYSGRHPERRPFFRPGVMLPKMCRAVVNISTVSGTFLDPMCGTGGIVIEASLSGLKAVGLELYPEIARGCKENLKALGVKAEVLCGNAAELPLKSNSIDGIATDFPYFQSSKSLLGKEELYERAVEEFYRVLKDNRRAVVVTNEERDFPPFRVLDVFRLRVHSSLTRYIYVLSV